MKLQSAYPLVTTRELRASRNFYVSHFGMEVIFEASWVVALGLPGRGEICLGLMAPDHPTQPPGPETFAGKGMIVTVQVEDAAEAFASLKRTGAPITYDLHDEPWGQRRFMTRDPGGVLLDVVEQTAPVEGYWEKYMPTAAADA
jgi:catechol 2,3-dioxygenase-like lactoylglutathione lyase family enzyme